MMEFIGIWYDMTREVKRDKVFAKDAADASRKIHEKYAGRKEPSMALSIIAANGYGSANQSGRAEPTGMRFR